MIVQYGARDWFSAATTPRGSLRTSTIPADSIAPISSAARWLNISRASALVISGGRFEEDNFGPRNKQDAGVSTLMTNRMLLPCHHNSASSWPPLSSH